MRHKFPLAVCLASLVVYSIVVARLDKIPREKEKDVLRSAIPAPVQVLLAGGDRYLAANIAVFRAVVVSTGELDPEAYEILGRVQYDAARLNPAHEDNYYTAQGILPWNGQLEADMFIQNEATRARPWDYLPPFFLGFDHYYFLHSSAAGAQQLELAASRSPAGNRESLVNMAARWYEKGDDPRIAAGMIEAMAKNTRDSSMRRLLEKRLVRMRGLVELRDAAAKFLQENNRVPRDLSELLGPDLLSALPIDPFGQGFALDSTGLPVFARPTAPAKQD